MRTVNFGMDEKEKIYWKNTESVNFYRLRDRGDLLIQIVA
jgi:hypothetical protein